MYSFSFTLNEDDLTYTYQVLDNQQNIQGGPLPLPLPLPYQPPPPMPLPNLLLPYHPPPPLPDPLFAPLPNPPAPQPPHPLPDPTLPRYWCFAFKPFDPNWPVHYMGKMDMLCSNC